jgi:hypothetical protein
MDSACIGIPRYRHHPAEPPMNLESNSHFASLSNAIVAGLVATNQDRWEQP